jgi:hypothetical protein
MSDVEKWKNKTRDYTKTKNHGAVQLLRKKETPLGAGFLKDGLKTASALDDDLGRLHAFRSLLGLEAHALPFSQGLEATTLDDGMMHEDILTAVLRFDKAKTLGIVEPLYCTSTH